MSAEAVKTSLLTGISSSFKTGNLVVDMLIVTIFSSFIGLIFSTLPALLTEKVPAWLNFFRRFLESSEDSVTIKYSAIYNDRHGEWIAADDEGQNKHLIDAIQEVLKDESIPCMEASLSQYSLKEGNTYERMRSKKILSTPVATLDFKDIKFSFEKNITGGGEAKSKTERSILLTMTSKKGSKYIKNFVDECYQEYVNQRYKQYDVNEKQIHYYMAEAEPKESSGFPIYNRYLLKNGKTFSNTFFPQKDEIVALIDKHQAKGKEQTQKLGFLLYGEPGCGKTSFIKALSNHTQRSVINVRLGNVRTNEELLHIFHNLEVSYNHHTDGNKYIESESIPMNERIFIFEDIDVDSQIVQKRASRRHTYKEDYDDIAPTTPSSSATTEDSQEKNTGKDKKVGPFLSFLEPKDPVNLSGLLNLLDGILELPGAIIVMSTNHPEKLDPALIRPGRITQKIFLGKMAHKEMMQLFNHYFPDEMEENQSKMESLKSGMFTPAELEAFCQTSTDLAQVISKVSEVQAQMQKKIDKEQRRRSLASSR